MGTLVDYFGSEVSSRWTIDPHVNPYRGTSLIINTPPLGPYSRTIPRVLW